METKNGLTPRQWQLYSFLKESKGYKTQQDMLEDYETMATDFAYDVEISDVDEYLKKYTYGYLGELANGIEWNNMSSARNLRKDLLALQNSDVIQKIIIKTKLADTVEEARTHLEKKLNRILKQLKTYHKEKVKLEKHLQTRLKFNQERDIILAVKGDEKDV